MILSPGKPTFCSSPFQRLVATNLLFTKANAQELKVLHKTIKKAAEDRNHKLILIDGDKLADLMIKYNVGIQTKSVYEIKEIDEDFFEVG